MADKNQIVNKIVLEGEAEYKRALDQINRSLRESKSALKAAAAEMDGAENSMDGMSRKGDALRRVLGEQEEALRLMGGQLEKVEAAYGANSREATTLRTRMNNLRAETAGTRTQLRQLESSMEGLRRSMDGADGEAARAGDAIAQLGQSAQRSEGGVGQLLDRLKEVAGINIGGLGLAGVGAAAAAAAKEGIEIADEQTAARGQMAAYTGKTGAELAALEETGKDVFRQGYGEDLMDASQGVATLHSYTGAIGEELQEATQYAFRMRDVFGHDIPESARTAQQLMTVFGLSAKDAYGLMAAGAQEGADKNGNLLDTLNEYAPYYERAGKSAAEFLGTLTAGSENGVYDIDKIGDAMKEFTLRITDGSDTTRDALAALGLEAADLPGKFARGGEGASAAFDLVIDALARIEDPLAQQSAAIALFGTQWEDTGGALLAIFDQIGMSSEDLQAHLDALNAERLNDLGEGMERVGRHIDTAAGEFFAPIAEGLAQTVHGIADSMDEMEKKADETQQRSEEAAAAAADATKDMYAELEALDERINAAWAEGNVFEALTLEAEKQRLIDEIAQTKIEVIEGFDEVGEAAAEALEGRSGDIEAAARESGEAATDGFAEGAEGMEDAADDTVDGAVGQLRRGASAAYNAGYATGSSYVRGYKAALAIASPSRVMEQAAEDTTSPLFDRFDADRRRLADAGAALGAAVSEGYASGGGISPAGASPASGGISAGEIAQAVKTALTGLAWEIGEQELARLIEPGVSQATTQRALATAKGQSSLNRRW